MREQLIELIWKPICKNKTARIGFHTYARRQHNQYLALLLRGVSAVHTTSRGQEEERERIQ